MLYFGMDLAEAFKILVVEEDSGGFIHKRNIRLLKKLPRELMKKGIFCGGNAVKIGALEGTETRMCFWFYFSNGEHPNFFGKNGVDGLYEVLTRGLVEVQVADLQLCMYARVGSTATQNGDGAAKKGAQCFFQTFLHRKGIALNLPAMKGATLVA